MLFKYAARGAEGACLRNLGRHVRQRKAKYLEPGDRMTELLAFLQIGPRVLVESQ